MVTTSQGCHKDGDAGRLRVMSRLPSLTPRRNVEEPTRKYALRMTQVT